jgi:hypothetical protein
MNPSNGNTTWYFSYANGCLPYFASTTTNDSPFQAKPARLAALIEGMGAVRAHYTGRFGWLVLDVGRVVLAEEGFSLIHESYDLAAIKMRRKK